MKKSSSVFLASLGFNFALLALIAIGAVTHFRPSPTTAAPAAAPSTPDPWLELKRDKLAELATRLKGEEFPDWAVRAILTAQVRERFAARRRELEARAAEIPYWRNQPADPQNQAELRALARQEQEMVAAVLGRDPERSAILQLRAHLPNIAAERIERLAEIQERYAEQRQVVRDLQRGMTTPDDREKLHQIDKAMLSEFATVLTFHELREYEMRTSSVASSLRYQLGDFELTEAEFRSVYSMKAEFEQAFPSWATRGPGDLNRRSAAEKNLEVQIAAALGPGRHAEYKRATDSSFRQAAVLVARTGLPPETAGVLYGIQREFEQRRDAIFALKEERAATVAALQKLHTEATSRLNAVFGGQAAFLEMYREYGGTWWTHLEPR